MPSIFSAFLYMHPVAHRVLYSFLAVSAQSYNVIIRFDDSALQFSHLIVAYINLRYCLNSDE